MTHRTSMVATAKGAVAGRSHFTYAEVRPMHLTATGPWKGDCSTFVTWVFWMEHLPDPNGNGYNGWGNTQTLYAKGQKISPAEVQPGDVVIYAADRPLSEQHTAFIIEGGHDPLTVSMGQQGDPSFVHVSQDGRRPFYVRFLPVDPTPAPPKPTPPHVVPVTSTLPVIAEGSASKMTVAAIQSILVARGGIAIGTSGPLHNGVDGVAGPLFTAGVKKFQTAHGLPSTGVVDVATWNALLGIS